MIFRIYRLGDPGTDKSAPVRVYKRPSAVTRFIRGITSPYHPELTQFQIEIDEGYGGSLIVVTGNEWLYGDYESHFTRQMKQAADHRAYLKRTLPRNK